MWSFLHSGGTSNPELTIVRKETFQRFDLHTVQDSQKVPSYVRVVQFQVQSFTKPWKSKTKQSMVFSMIYVKDSLLPMGKVWSLDFLGKHYPLPKKTPPIEDLIHALEDT